MTQLELLIALGIMGLMAILFASALDFSRLALGRSKHLSEETQKLLLQNDLRDWAARIPLVYGTEDATAFLDGDPDRLMFQTLMLDGSFWPGEFVQVEVKVNASVTPAELTIQLTGRHPDLDQRKEARLVLAQNARDLTLRYFGRNSEDGIAAWYDSWSDPTFLPELIRIEWDSTSGTPSPPLTLLPGWEERHKYMSRSSLVPPG